MIRAGIVGGTGYTGVELLRILVLHAQVEVAVVTSRADAGVRVDVVTHWPGMNPALKQEIERDAIQI